MILVDTAKMEIDVANKMGIKTSNIQEFLILENDDKSLVMNVAHVSALE